MARPPRFIRRLQSNGELWSLMSYFLITALSTVIGLALRYILLYLFAGSYDVSLFGRVFTVDVDDNLAYTVYYIVSTVLMYLFKWFSSDGLRGHTFVPRMIAFVLLCVISMLAGNAVLALLLHWDLHSELAFWLTCPITFLINYLGNRLFVFSDADNRQARRSKRLKKYQNHLKERAKRNGGQKNTDANHRSE